MLNNSEDIQMKFYQSGDKGASLLPISFEDWEKRAKQVLGAGPFDYVSGAAGAGDTLRANLKAFQKYQIRPRICRDVSKMDLTIHLFGKNIPVPFLLAPIGMNSVLHPEAELAPAKAAAKLGVPYILSNVSTKSMEDVAKAMGDALRWFQLYPPKDHELTNSFLKRAEDAGYSAIVVTNDSTLLGWREKDLQNAYFPFLSGEGMGNYFSDPIFLSKLEEPPEKNVKAASKKALEQGNNTSFTWKELEYICKQTSLPVILKGVTHPDDALLALEYGVAGIIVSNHGGRQLDGAVATLDVLPSICRAIENKIPVLVDSGIRRGADIIKAIALGASAVLIGRPYAYALGVAGEIGVKEVLENFIAETELQLAISGRSTIKEVDRLLVTEEFR
ncbi:alpha-hydroxy-acid oxidizing protein [Neobacillus sp. NPDC093182]|uniref:alpha-hydroxy-acid oxidizing protein n=1 Tax=Neobacillus sp. NPDC093182 TaxID=3364297 RepID=UPI003827EFCA